MIPIGIFVAGLVVLVIVLLRRRATPTQSVAGANRHSESDAVPVWLMAGATDTTKPCDHSSPDTSTSGTGESSAAPDCGGGDSGGGADGGGGGGD